MSTEFVLEPKDYIQADDIACGKLSAKDGTSCFGVAMQAKGNTFMVTLDIEDARRLLKYADEVLNELASKREKAKADE